MTQPPSTINGAAGSTFGDEARKAAAEAARQIQEAWRQTGECDLPSAIAQHPAVLQERSFFLDLVQQEYSSLRDEWRDRSPSAYCERFDGLTPGLRSSLFRLIEVERYLDSVPELGGSDVGLSWPNPGEDFAGFEVDEEIGRGAVGRVYRCRQRALGGREVVVKITRLPATEAESLGRLDHPNVVPIYSAGTDSATGLGWICMPYITRRTLADRIPGNPSEPPVDRPGLSETLRMFASLADALDHIHRRGMLHGDLKPSNVLSPADGRPMLIDFNLAVSVADSNPAGGTPRYMAPEQLRALERSEGRTVGQTSVATEVFSFAVLLSEVMLGEPPFESRGNGLAEAARSLLQAHGTRTHDVIARLRHIDPGVAGLVARCMAEDPRTRPGSFTAIRDTLGSSLGVPARLRRFSRRKPLSAAVVLFAAIGVTAFAATRLPKAPRVDSVSNARAAIQAGESRAGEQMLRRLVESGSDDAEALRLLGEIDITSAEYLGAAERFLEAWQVTGAPRDLAMAAYCRNLEGDHKGAEGLYARSIAAGLRDPAVESNYAASLLVSLRKAYDDRLSRLAERNLLRAFEAAPENETVRLHMLRHYLLAAEQPSRRLPEYPPAIAESPERGASDDFRGLAARFLALLSGEAEAPTPASPRHDVAGVSPPDFLNPETLSLR